MVNDTTLAYPADHVAPSFLRALPRRQPGPEQHGGEHRDQRRLEHLPVWLGLFDQPGLQWRHCAHRVLCRFAASWAPAMIRQWNADPFGFLRPWGGEVPALIESAPPATPPLTGTGVVTFLMA
jgi:hypothetical protein